MKEVKVNVEEKVIKTEEAPEEEGKGGNSKIDGGEWNAQEQGIALYKTSDQASPPSFHANPDALLSRSEYISRITNKLEEYGLSIPGLENAGDELLLNMALYLSCRGENNIFFASEAYCAIHKVSMAQSSSNNDFLLAGEFIKRVDGMGLAFQKMTDLHS